MKEAKRRARSKKGAPHATFEIAHDVRDALGKDVGLRILERSDMLAASTLEQLRKSTDRAYTLFGFLMTAFSAVTGLLMAAKGILILIPGVVLWIGLCISLYIMFGKVIWVHSFRCMGNEPQNLISERNIKMLKGIYGTKQTLSRRYELNLIYDSIEDCAYAIAINDSALEDRVRTIELVMNTLKITISGVVLSVLLITVFRFIN